MEWTAGQLDVLAHAEGRLRVLGPDASGRTSVLVERWRRRVDSPAGPSGVVVLCHSRVAAERFRRAGMAGGLWAAETLPVTTVYGLAFDLLRRAGDDRRLLGSAEQWALVRRMLDGDREPSRWPSCPELVGRPAFVEQVVGGLRALGSSGANPAAVREVARAFGQGPRWDDLIAFSQRYAERVRALGAVDGAQLLAEATATLESAPGARGPGSAVLVEEGPVGTTRVRSLGECPRWDEVLVDDADRLLAQEGQLIDALAPSTLIVAGREASSDAESGWPAWGSASRWARTLRFNPLSAPPSTRAAVCRHPSLEAEEVAAQLFAAHERGVAWGDMAVLARGSQPGLPGIARTLQRYQIPAGPAPVSPVDDPAVRAILDFFAWTEGDHDAFRRLMVSPAVDLAPAELRRLARTDRLAGANLPDHPRITELIALRDGIAARLAAGSPSDGPADIAYDAWIGLLGALVPDPDIDTPGLLSQRSLGAVAEFLAGVNRRAAQDPAWRMADEVALLDAPELDHDPRTALASSRVDALDGSGEGDVVTLATISAAQGRTWDVVVVIGCLEGGLPRLTDGRGYFDPLVARRAALAQDAGEPPGIEERRASALEGERRLFETALARGRHLVIAVAAPAPGQIVSRFAAPLDASAGAMAAAGTWPHGRLGKPLDPVSVTESAVPVDADGTLDLSATRLKTYEDCPLRYFYQYALGVRGPSGVAASMGTVVHGALASFLDPARSAAGRDWPALEAIAEQLWSGSGWSDTIAPFQPLREQARRDIFKMLEEWWTAEAVAADAAGAWPEVIAVEYPFVLTLGGHRVRGVIDRVDRVPGGIAIIDYKTGSTVPPPGEVADDLQLALYHLAALADPMLSGEGPPVSLRLDYLRKRAVVEQPIGDDHASRTERRVMELAQRILGEAFEPSVEADCEYCDFHRLCPLQEEGRAVTAE